MGETTRGEQVTGANRPAGRTDKRGETTRDHTDTGFDRKRTYRGNLPKEMDLNTKSVLKWLIKLFKRNK